MKRYPIFWQIFLAGLALMLVYWFFSSGNAKGLASAALSVFGFIFALPLKYLAYALSEVREAEGFFDAVFHIVMFFYFVPLILFGVPIYVCYIAFHFLKDPVEGTSQISQRLKAYLKTLPTRIKEGLVEAFGTVGYLLFCLFIAVLLPLGISAYAGLPREFVWGYWFLLGCFLFWLFFLKKT